MYKQQDLYFYGPGCWDKAELLPQFDVPGSKYTVLTGYEGGVPKGFPTPRVAAMYFKEGGHLCFEQQSSITICCAPGYWVNVNEMRVAAENEEVIYRPLKNDEGAAVA